MLFGRRSWEISCRFYEFFVNFVSPAYEEHRAKSFGIAIEKTKSLRRLAEALDLRNQFFFAVFTSATEATPQPITEAAISK